MNSVLNPEAPEFYPHITSFTKGAYTSINKTIKTSNCFPSGASYDLFKTFTDFNIVTCQLSESVFVQSKEIIVSEFPNVKLKRKDTEYNTEIIVDTTDRMLDRIHINIDKLCKGDVDVLEGARPGTHTSSWNNKPVIAKIQVGTTTFFGAKNIPRPQLTFKDPIDNSESLWVPKISDKPNNIKPLALNIIYNEKGEAVGYEHPYKVELEAYSPPAEALAAGAEPAPPAPLEATPLARVDTPAQLDALVAHLAAETELAVDLEHHSYRTYQGFTCLIQITTSRGDFIIDALALRDHLHKLNLSFTDPSKVKVFHGAEYDVVWLQRDFGVYLVGMFDTHQAARLLGLPGLALKHLLKHYCQVDADKKYQLADWRIRPLPAELVQYARGDTHYLLYVWRRMRAELLAAAAGRDHLLRAAFERSRQLCAATYSKPVVSASSHEALYSRSRKAFDARQLAALRLLYRWRDTHARLLDESTTYLLPNHMLLALAEALPREVQGVAACCSPTPPFVKQNLVALHRMLLSCRELPVEEVSRALEAGGGGCAGAGGGAGAGAEGGALAGAHAPRAPRLLQLHDGPRAPDPRALADTALSATSENVAKYMKDTQEPQRALLDLLPELDAADRASPLQPFVSKLNVDAKQFVPPFDRLRKYRSMNRDDELKEFEKIEARVEAIGKGDVLIETEVLAKIKQAKQLIQEEEKKEEDTNLGSKEVESKKEVEKKCKEVDKKNKEAEINEEDEDEEESWQKKGAQRKRKMSQEKAERRGEAPAGAAAGAGAAAEALPPRRYNYKHANYRKFHDDRDKPRHQPKMKFKKHS